MALRELKRDATRRLIRRYLVEITEIPESLVRVTPITYTSFVDVLLDVEVLHVSVFSLPHLQFIYNTIGQSSV